MYGKSVKELRRNCVDYCTQSIPSPNFINLVFVGRIDNPPVRYGKKVQFNPIFNYAGWHPALQNRLRDCLISPLFDHKGTKPQRLEGKNFVALCLGDFVAKLLNSL